MGKQREIYIYIYSYFGMFSEYIHDFEVFFFFFFGAWCLGVKKMWESKGTNVFFFFFDLFGF